MLVRGFLDSARTQVPEFDVPGHAYSWGLSPGLRGITASCPRYANGLGHVNDIPLDPTNPLTYEVLGGLLGDAAAAFPDDHFHWGGDELQVPCWNESKAVVAWMEANGYADRSLNDFIALEDSFYQQAQALLSQAAASAAASASAAGAGGIGCAGGAGGAPKRAVVWEEVFFPAGAWVDRADTFPPNGTVIETWTGPAFLPEATSRGYDAILAYVRTSPCARHHSSLVSKPWRTRSFNSLGVCVHVRACA